ncbi:mre11 [Trypoxylus dichotomus]
MSEEASEESTFKILIASDNHLGYAERKPNLSQDSFRTFEEILQIAVKNEVDFVLLGGDLFHESQPSSYCLQRCTELLKKYCLGDRPVSIEFLSDQSEHFNHLKNPIVNYEDPDLNVSLPIFSIHGNHDSPNGNQLVSALDILSSTGLINYFGRWTDLSKVEIKPLLLKKGDTKLAIYGLSHISDQRLARLFQDKKVKMPYVGESDWFNILVLHQNRANRGIKNFIPDHVIPKFIDLVIWGHEHDCIMEPQQCMVGGPMVVQPGSSVATSLSEGEATDKHVGLLKIHKNMYKMIPIRLTSVRPFIFDDIVLCKPDTDDYDSEAPRDQAINDIKRKVEEMIQRATIKQEDNNQAPLLPLIRLIVKYYTEAQVLNSIRLGHMYENRVANPGEMFKFSNFVPKERQKKTNGVSSAEDNEFCDVDDWASRVEDVVEKYFENYARGDKMKVLSVKLMTQAVSRFVDVSDNDAMKVAFESQLNRTVSKLEERNADCDQIAESLEIIKQERIRDEDKEVIELAKEFEKERKRPKDTVEMDITNGDDDNDDCVQVVDEVSQRPARGRGSRGGAKAPRKTRARGARAK